MGCTTAVKKLSWPLVVRSQREREVVLLLLLGGALGAGVAADAPLLLPASAARGVARSSAEAAPGVSARASGRVRRSSSGASPRPGDAAGRRSALRKAVTPARVRS